MNRVQRIFSALPLLLACSLFLAACQSRPIPDKALIDAETCLEDYVKEIEAGILVPVLKKGVKVKNRKNELANMKRTRIDRARQVVRTCRAARGIK